MRGCMRIIMHMIGCMIGCMTVTAVLIGCVAGCKGRVEGGRGGGIQSLRLRPDRGGGK